MAQLDFADDSTTIKVNDEDVVVNKYVLAHSSPYFDRYFYDERYPAADNIELPESTNVEDFKRMIASLPPEQRPLDDDCVEAVIILADRFAMDNVLELCRNFLMTSSKLKMFAFRIAGKYGWNKAEKEILKSMRYEDFNAENFVANATEFDDCIEAVLTLADRFFMDNVMKLGRDFLLTESRKPKLFKFRIAHRYGWKEMKEKVLESISLDEFSMHFFENAAELALLDEDAKAALAAHHAKLVSGMKK